MKITNDKNRIEKAIQIGDVVAADFKVVRNGKIVGYDFGKASVIKMNDKSFWMINPFTNKEEAYNINTLMKKYFFDKIKNRWEYLRKYSVVNMECA